MGSFVKHEIISVRAIDHVRLDLVMKMYVIVSMNAAEMIDIEREIDEKIVIGTGNVTGHVSL